VYSDVDKGISGQDVFLIGPICPNRINDYKGSNGTIAWRQGGLALEDIQIGNFES